MKAKRIRWTLALVIALASALCAVIIWISVRNSTDKTPILPSDETDVAYALKDIGIMQGDGSSFNLNTVPDRVQAAIMVVRMRGEAAAAEAAYAAGETENPFADVTEAWAAPYVAWIYGSDLTLTDRITDGGHAPCTAAEYLTLMLRTLGYTDAGDSPDFTYDSAAVLARKAGIYLDSFIERPLDRGTLANITYLTLAATVKDTDRCLLSVLTEAGAIDRDAARELLETFGAVEDPIGQVDMKGKTVTLLADVGGHSVIGGHRPILGDAEGDLIDAALYRRTAAIERLCNVELDVRYAPSALMTEQLALSVKAEDEAYDICIGNAADTVFAAASGLLAELSALEGVDLTQPWWHAQINTALSVGGRQYMASGDFLPPEYGAQVGLYYLPKTVLSLGFDDPAVMVSEGTWTQEAFLQIARAYGDTSLSLLSDRHFPQYLYNAAGNIAVGIDETGLLAFAPDVKAADAMRSLYGAIPSVWVADSTQNFDPAANLSTGRLLFVCGSTANARQFFSPKSALAIVPMPRSDEKQASYRTPTVLSELQVLSVPVTQSDDRIGRLLSRMNCNSSAAERAEAEQYARNRNAQMLAVMRENAVIDLCGLSDVLVGAFEELAVGGRGTQSVFDAYRKQIDERYAEINTAFGN